MYNYSIGSIKMFERIKNLFKREQIINVNVDTKSLESKIDKLIKLSTPKTIPDNKLDEQKTLTSSGAWTVNTCRGSQAEISTQIAGYLGSRRLGTEFFVLGSYWDGTQNEAVAILLYKT